MTKMILPLDFFLLGGAFISPCENEELTVESGIPACQPSQIIWNIRKTTDHNL